MAYVTIRELSMARAKIAKPAKNRKKPPISDLPHVWFSLSAAESPKNSHNTRTFTYISTQINCFFESATLCSSIVIPRAHVHVPTSALPVERTSTISRRQLVLSRFHFRTLLREANRFVSVANAAAPKRSLGLGNLSLRLNLSYNLHTRI